MGAASSSSGSPETFFSAEPQPDNLLQYPMKERIVVGMSGGVDSAVTAALLVEQGFEVIGVTMLIWNPPGMDRAEQGGCCGLGAAEDARRVAARLGIRHYVLDFQDVFYDTVIRNYADEYRAGRTPNPCIRCNEFVKFGALLQRAEQLGAERVATGHYARIRQDEATGRWLLLRGADPRKDQSYALYRLKQEQLERTLFPLGEMAKKETRGRWRRVGSAGGQKPDSQEVCFVPDNNYPSLLAQLVPESRREGEVVDPEGRVLGRHQGVAGFTMGQRKGLGIASSLPLYVTTIDPMTNRLTVASGDHPTLCAREVVATDTHLIVAKEPGDSCSVTAKIRYNMPDRPATLAVGNGGRLRVTFAEPQRAVTPGQALVCYDGEVVVGGGVIESVTLDPERDVVYTGRELSVSGEDRNDTLLSLLAGVGIGALVGAAAALLLAPQSGGRPGRRSGGQRTIFAEGSGHGRGHARQGRRDGGELEVPRRRIRRRRELGDRGEKPRRPECDVGVRSWVFGSDNRTSQLRTPNAQRL